MNNFSLLGKKLVIYNRHNRIGHLFHDLYTFYVSALMYPDKLCLIILNPKQIANKQAYKMWLRKFKENSISYIEIKDEKEISNFYYYKNILDKNCLSFYDTEFNDITIYYKNLIHSNYLLGSTTFDRFEYRFHNKFNIKLSFTSKEESIGTNFLKRLNIKENSFVIFHSRDSLYLHNNLTSYCDFRNVNFSSYFKTIKYLSSMDIHSIRFGKIQKDEINQTINKFINYAEKFQTDFRDIYLISKAKYFVGCTSGPILLAGCFNKPSIKTNQIPLTAFYNNNDKDLFIWKKLVDKNTNQLIPLETILKYDLCFDTSEEYISNGISIIDNTDEEILQACKEMEFQLNFNSLYTNDSDNLLLKNFTNLIKKYSPKTILIGKPSLNFLKNYPLYETDNIPNYYTKRKQVKPYLDEIKFVSNKNYLFSKEFNIVFNKLEELKKDNKNYLIYGYGSIGITIKHILGKNVIAFIDKDISKIDNKYVFLPDEINQLKFDKIIISVLGRESEIIKELIEIYNITANKIFFFTI